MLRRIARFRRLTSAVLLTLALSAAGATVARTELAVTSVFAAASLKEAFDAVAAAWHRQTGKSVTLTYAASSALARQIEQGAPADLFASADLDWMDYLQQRGLIDASSRVNLLGNSLVLIAPADPPHSFTLLRDADLGAFLGDGRLAIPEVRSVPAGKYGKQALEALGLWKGVEGKLAQTDTVRSALALVARGEAAAGVVYATDARVEPKVTLLGTFPAETHAPIVYPVALVAAATKPDAAAFLAFLRSPEAARIYADLGFRVLP